MKPPVPEARDADHGATTLTEEQLLSLGSPARHEVFGTLLRIGPASVGEIAAVLEQPADGLYYHIRNLVRAGLVRDLGKRPASTRPESVYEVSTKLLRTHPTDRSPGYLRALKKLFDSTLRLLSRRVVSALGDADIARTGRGRQVSMRNQLARLDQVGLAELNRRLDELSEFLGERSLTEGGDLYQVVIASTVLPRGNPSESTPASGSSGDGTPSGSR